jgi:ribosomal protein L7/L12
MSAGDDRLIEKAKKMWKQSHDYERILRLLRTSGTSKLDSIKAVRLVCGAALGDAKRIVNASDVWRDTLTSTVSLHQAVNSALESGNRS